MSLLGALQKATITKYSGFYVRDWGWVLRRSGCCLGFWCVGEGAL